MENPVSRRKPAREAFEKKLMLLEDAVSRRRIALEVPNLRTMQDFCGWEDKDHGISTWSNTQVVNKKGPNADLRARLDHIWLEIQLLQGRRGSKKPERRSSSEKAREQQINILNLQVYKLIVERNALRDGMLRSQSQVASLEQERDALLEENADLKAQRKKIVTLVPRG